MKGFTILLLILVAQFSFGQQVLQQNKNEQKETINVTIDFCCDKNSEIEQNNNAYYKKCGNEQGRIVGKTVEMNHVMTSGMYDESKLQDLLRDVLTSHNICESNQEISFLNSIDLDGFIQKQYAYIDKKNQKRCLNLILPRID